MKFFYEVAGRGHVRIHNGGQNSQQIMSLQFKTNIPPNKYRADKTIQETSIPVHIHLHFTRS